MKNPWEIPKACPECGKALKSNLGKYGPFLGCIGYPECKFIFNISNYTRIKCPECGNILVVRKAKKYNFFFLGCSNYPKCKFLLNTKKYEVKCPECGSNLAIRDSRYGKFIGCMNYPVCKYKLDIRSTKLGNLLKLEITTNEKYIYQKPKQIERIEIKNSSQDLKDIKEKLKLYNIDLQDAHEICRIAVENGYTTDIRILIIVSLYLLTKIKGIYVGLKKFAKVSGIPSKVLYKKYKLLYRDILPLLNYQIKRLSINDYINQFSNDLDLSEEIKQLSYKTIKLAQNEGFYSSGKDPKGIAAAAIYISSKAVRNRINQHMIATIADITEVTLRTRVKELNNFLSLNLLREK